MAVALAGKATDHRSGGGPPLMKNHINERFPVFFCHRADAISSPVSKNHAMARRLQTKKSNRNEKREHISAFEFIFRFGRSAGFHRPRPGDVFAPAAAGWGGRL
jgi:hypothetical protein